MTTLFAHRWRKAAIAVAMLLALLASVFLFHALRATPAANFSADLSKSSDWISYGGSWASSDAEIFNVSKERGAKLINQHATWEDFQLDADLALDDSTGEAGILFRSYSEEEGVHAYHGYYAGVDPIQGTLTLSRSDFGAHTLALVHLPAQTDYAKWFHLRIIAIGCRMGIELTSANHDKSYLMAEDHSCIAKGHIGLRSSLSGAKWKSLFFSPARSSELAEIARQATAQADSPALASAYREAAASRLMESYAQEARRYAPRPDIKPIGSFTLYPGRYDNVDVRGIVISAPPMLVIQDDSRSITINSYVGHLALRPGDMVEAHGAVVCQPFWCGLEDAKIRILWSELPASPLSVTSSQLIDGYYRGRPITIDGTLVSSASSSKGYDLVLTDQVYRFRAIGTDNFQLKAPQLKIGSRLRLRGTATARDQYTHGIYPFIVITNSIEIVSGPPFWTTAHILWILALGVALAIGIMIAIHYLQRWHIRALLRERELMALEMHDTLAQSFTGISYQLQAADREKRGMERVREHIQSALTLVKHSHREVSRTISSLKPQYRDAAEIVASLKTAAARLCDEESVTIAATFSGRNRVLPLPITDALFRIGQEAISNAMLHAACTELKIDLTLARRVAILTIQDDGVGFKAEVAGKGMGLEGMQSRALKIKAEFQIVSSPGAGTRVQVKAHLPLVSAFQRMLIEGRL